MGEVEESITTTRAIEIAIINGHRITRPTVIRWAKAYHIGKKIGGRWSIDAKKLKKIIKEGIDE